MADTLLAFGASALPPLLSLLMLLLGAYVALDLAQRALRLDVAERKPWLLAASVALGAALWAATVLGVADPLVGKDIGFDATRTAMAALASTLLCGLGLHVQLAAPSSSVQRLWGAAALGAGVLAAQMLVLNSLTLASPIHWNVGLLTAAWSCAGAGFAWALRGPDPLPRPGAMHRQLLAAAKITITALLAQTLVMAAAGLGAHTAAPLSTGIAADTMLTLASIGGAELLLLMLLACFVESRMRGSLERARGELQAQTLRDELTGLPNRVGFERTLAQAQQAADASHQGFALLLVALDGFRHVNENHGHHTGDALLQQLAQRLRELLPAQPLARLGGDELLMLVEGEQAAQRAGAVATQVLEAIARPFRVDDLELDISASVGVALYPKHGAMSALITHASVAMRASKNAGGASYSIFDPRMVVDNREQVEMLRDLRQAVHQSQLELYFQPKVHAPSGQITGAEALLRWHHPRRGMISPEVFIPMAERSGLIDALGAWVIDEACRQARVWRDQGLRMRVAVNLSAHQLRQTDLPQSIAAALRKHQINPDLLTCEITESVAMEDTEATMQFFTELAAVGVHISIDDFGSGYSSLAYLRKLPASELKIDRSFVLDLAHSEEARTIAAAVVRLAQALNLKVVAEGVETEEQFQILRQLGCDELQGFLFAKPMSAKALGLWAMNDEGPRAIEFSESLFQETRAVAL